jgi:RimJ/RimL family protein N-acetyltransferase
MRYLGMEWGAVKVARVYRGRGLAQAAGMFETSRLRLRAFEEADAGPFHEWWNDAALVAWQSTGFLRPVTAAENLARLKGWVKDSLIYCCAETLEERQLIGTVNLWGADAKNRACQLAIIIGRPFWGQGFGREMVGFITRHAFVELGVHRIGLQVAAENERAIKCYRACGFREEGRQREATWQNGRWQDELLMGMLAGELPD